MIKNKAPFNKLCALVLNLRKKEKVKPYYVHYMETASHLGTEHLKWHEARELDVLRLSTYQGTSGKKPKKITTLRGRTEVKLSWCHFGLGRLH